MKTLLLRSFVVHRSKSGKMKKVIPLKNMPFVLHIPITTIENAKPLGYLARIIWDLARIRRSPFYVVIKNYFIVIKNYFYS